LLFGHCIGMASLLGRGKLPARARPRFAALLAHATRSSPATVRDSILRQADTRLDLSPFCSFGSFALELETVHDVLSSDYNRYMDIQQAVYFELHEAFEREQIELAYLTQKLLGSRAATRTWSSRCSARRMQIAARLAIESGLLPCAASRLIVPTRKHHASSPLNAAIGESAGPGSMGR
jgi:hypothetical protein